MARCLIAMGANLGDRLRQIAAAQRQLNELSNVHVLAVSRAWPTCPVGGPPGQPPFLNAAVLIETELPAANLLKKLQKIEYSLGRRRSVSWDARPIDLDILLYGSAIVHQADLVIPHPWMVSRPFVLGPAAEIAPEMEHPLLGWSMMRLWRHVQSASPRFAVVGCSDPTALQAVAQTTGMTCIADASGILPATRESSSVPSFQQQLEWLTRRTERLCRRGWNLPQPQLSEFWIDQSWVRAQTTLHGDEIVRFEREFARAERLVEQPKLVVLATGRLRAEHPAASRTASQVEEWIAGLLRQVIRRDAFPLIEVDSTVHDDFVREVAGAITAMQSSATEPSS